MCYCCFNIENKLLIIVVKTNVEDDDDDDGDDGIPENRLPQ